MSSREYITVIIDEQGQARVEAHQVKGKGCSKLTAFITTTLGQVRKVVRKPAYYASAKRKSTQQVHHE